MDTAQVGDCPESGQCLRSATTDPWYQQFKTPCPYPDKATLHELFRASAQKYPERIALEDPTAGKRLTYRQLDVQSDLLCKYLRSQGVRFENVVGIYMENSVEFMIAYVAILKTGGAYMPLEIAYPDKLLSNVLDDSKPIAVLTKAHCAGKLPPSQVVFNMDDDWVTQLENDDVLRDWKDAHEDPDPHPDSLAYVVYSSGTTGKPKGICCPHRGSVFSYTWRHENYPYIGGDRIACNVFMTWEAFRPFLRGATTVVITDDIIYDPPRLVKFLQDEKINRILMTPSLCQACLDSPGLVESHDLSLLRLICLCGEVVTADLTQRIRKLLPHVQIPNLYSISECHDVSCVDLSKVKLDSKYAKCGYVNDNVEVYVLDDETKNVVPRGTPGGVYVAGCTLAIGYLNRPKLTADRFFMWLDKDIEGAEPIRLYYTGDNGLLRHDGQLEILGRAAFFVKIRGYSVVLGQIEVALIDHPAVKSAVVLAVGAEGEDKQLIAYVVINGGTERPSKAEIVNHVASLVPAYSVPPNYVVLEQLPLSIIGKLERKRLPPLEKVPLSQMLQEKQAEICALTTETEMRLAALWEKNIEAKVTSAKDNYFFIGGHSLSAGALLRAVKKAFGVQLSVSNIYKTPTLGGFAALIDAALTPTEEQKLSEEDDEFERDAQLPSSVVQTWDGAHPEHVKCVLLTGATGFLGAYLLNSVLERSQDAEVVVLGRAGSAGLMSRIKTNLLRYGLWQPGMLERVSAVAGDLGAKNLGLKEGAFNDLANRCDMVIHCAAAVNLLKSYKELKPVNIDAVVDLLRLTCTGNPSRFVYISTNGVFEYDGGEHTEESPKPTRGKLNDGYCQSKSVAEDIVLAAAAAGLPVQVHRVGNLVPDAAKGVWNGNDFLAALFASGCRYGLPELSTWEMRLTPVDWAASAIVGLAFAKDGWSEGIYHIANGSPVAFSQISKWLGAGEALPFTDFLTRIRNADASDDEHLPVLQAILATAETPSDMSYTRLGQLLPEQTTAALNRLGLATCPPISEKHVGVWKASLGVDEQLVNLYVIDHEAVMSRY